MGLLVFLFLLNSSSFVVDVTTTTSYTVDLSRETLRGYVDDIGLFARHMPGVVSVKPVGENTFLYQTEKQIPLAGKMSTDFLIAKSVVGDSVTLYRSVSIDDPNYMSCAVTIKPVTENSTQIHIRLRLRLSRNAGSEIHWLAPVLGEAFIESRMRADMESMLATFVASSNRELYSTLLNQTSQNR